MVRMFDTFNQTSTGLGFVAREFNEENLGVFVVYDTPVNDETNYQDYFIWNACTVTTSTGIIEDPLALMTPYQAVPPSPITPSTEDDSNTEVNVILLDNNSLFTNRRQAPEIDYSQLLDQNFHLMTPIEFRLLRQLIARLDMVRSRYPNRFEKKFTVEEYLIFLEAALVDINLTPPVSRFWWFFTSTPDATQQYQYNPMMQQNGAWGVPEILHTLLIEGAMIHALIAKGILEVDLSFSYSDQGLSLTYDNSSAYSSWYDRMAQRYTEKKKIMKQNFRPKGLGIGTIPEFGIGWFGALNSMLDNRYNQIFYPFWLSGNSGRAQL